MTEPPPLTRRDIIFFIKPQIMPIILTSIGTVKVKFFLITKYDMLPKVTLCYIFFCELKSIYFMLRFQDWFTDIFGI